MADKLVLATGSSPRWLSDEVNSGLEGVFAIRTISDVERLRSALLSDRKL